MTLVDTDGQGVERITETGVVFDGVEYEVDCLIFATGFEIGRTTYTKQAELEIFGRDGLSLADYWADGMRTFHGFYSHGFLIAFTWDSRKRDSYRISLICSTIKRSILSVLSKRRLLAI